MERYRLGLDIGSTTAKAVLTDGAGDILFSKYIRHNADMALTLDSIFKEIQDKYGDIQLSAAVTGCVGMGLSDKLDLTFVQEVVAATKLVKEKYPDISTIIDIGGEDAKIVYLGADGSVDLRMNGNCAGGTGAFIDQTAILLGVDITELDGLAAKSERLYPIASRCGVFSKTDIQNLISKNVSKEDIAASVFHAITVQTIVTLSHGCEVKPKLFFCGGPLTFIPSLRRAFAGYLKLNDTDYATADNANIITAWGTALFSNEEETLALSALAALIREKSKNITAVSSGLEPIFKDEAEYTAWKADKENNNIVMADISEHKGYAWLGIDSGSTTTKIVVTDEQNRVLFTHYTNNGGNPIAAVKNGLTLLSGQCKAKGIKLMIKGSASTGYGEDLIKAAFNLNHGIIETIAHYLSAKKINPNVSFILDIGGQDMKAMFIDKGVLNRMEINEACSSGCGSFIETFAKSLNFAVPDFAREACLAQNPSDLGTRCTVFMNSKVKQVLREGAGVGDIAAGLSYSVVKNCLYKVLKLREESDLGDKIVVQGGTMRNDSVVRALEKLTGKKVYRSSMPELMGALGCALYAASASEHAPAVSLDSMLAGMSYDTRQIQCRGCENNCFINKYDFNTQNSYYSGNKCEKIFSNKGGETTAGTNVYMDKYNMLFARVNGAAAGENKKTVGIARALNMYEDYPLWHTLFTECGIEVKLSDPSTFKSYEEGVHSVMSDNICFPAKLMHSHIYNLIEKRVDRIFVPYVVYEKPDGKDNVNTFNCPIVSGYSDVIRSVIDKGIPVDNPAFSLKDKELFANACREYLSSVWGIKKSVINKSVAKALAAQEAYEREIKELNKKVYEEGAGEGRMTVLLAGRPYHTDPLVQHKISDMIAAMGADVITEDVVRGDESISVKDSYHVAQWAYITRILKAAKWAAEKGGNVHFVQMTSFGCGPDAFLIDEVRGILSRAGKALTLLKIDDVNNIGSLKLRVRSLIESLKFSSGAQSVKKEFATTKTFTASDRKRKILVPFINDYISPVIVSICKVAGYDIEVLPKSDTDSAEYGLKYANNEVCYPATLVVGDIIKALKSGKYDTSNTTVLMTQTGGQCRASNYISLIKRAMVDAGYKDVPVISLGFGDGVNNEQAGLKINWLKILPVTFTSILYIDTIAKFYHASVVRENERGSALKLRDKYLALASEAVYENKSAKLIALIKEAAREFNSILAHTGRKPKVGVVGEIYLKFNSFANKHVSEWLMDKNIEVVPPALLNFFLQAFVNTKVNTEMNLGRKPAPDFVMKFVYSLAYRHIQKVNKAAAEFKLFTPFTDIFTEAEYGREVISLAAQFGEGWLLPAEIVSFARHDVHNVISLQPFGCIANHVISKGVEKKIKDLYPHMNLLSLDFDSGVSDVNVTNRLLLFSNNLK
ncbi:CoA-substrate-specific enzyme activase [Parelusimicrobium proximum]|uniref:acyl-CoA dehydratase activase-related protein n=1 Tax=Parelusimicrobium proximum TaxID=3228953 RepID=UPI003D17F44B